MGCRRETENETSRAKLPTRSEPWQCSDMTNRIPVAFNDQGRKELMEWLRANVKPELIDTLETRSDEWLEEVFERTSDFAEGDDPPSYELSASESKTGTPTHFATSADSYEFAEAD